jgi:hypothetical protein
MASCFDLRPWIEAHRYRWHYEEGYSGSEPDVQWFIEVLCKNGFIYPYGGTMLCCYAKSGVRAKIAGVPSAIHHQHDGSAEVFRFHVGQLDQIAAILKPRRKRAVGRSPEQMRLMRERRKGLVEVNQINQGRTESVGLTWGQGRSLEPVFTGVSSY